MGVKVSEIYQSQAEAKTRYQPDHPLADENGNVFMSNVNMVEEMTNMIEASRSYQTNIQLANTAKQLIQQTLRLGS
jgi:flagellar basal-body rod protein FlgC